MALDNNYTGLTKLKDWWGKVKANFTYLDERISTIITTPVDGVSVQEIIDARKGETALGDKIDAMDAAHASHLADKAKHRFNIIDYGAHSTTEEGYETFDSSEAITSAINAALAAGCSEIWYPYGRYLALSIQGADKVSHRGDNATLVKNGGAAGTYIMEFVGTETATTTALSGNASIFDNHADVASINGFNAGDYVLIRDTTYKHSTLGRNQEICQIDSVTPAILNFKRRLIGNYATASGAEIVKINAIADVKVKGLKFEIPVGTAGGGLHGKLCVGHRIEGNEVSGANDRPSIFYEASYDCDVTNRNVIKDGQNLNLGGYGYGIIFGESCHNCHATYNTISNVRANACTDNARACSFDWNTVENCYDTGFNSHGTGCEYITAVHNLIMGCNKGMAIGYSTNPAADKHISFEHNRIINSGTYAIVATSKTDKSLNHSFIHVKHNEIDTYGLSAEGHGVNISYCDEVEAIDNSINGVGANATYGVRIAYCTKVKVKINGVGNISNGYGIAYGPECDQVEVDENSIHDVSAANIREIGTNTNASVRNNKSDDTTFTIASTTYREGNIWGAKKDHDWGFATVGDGGTISHNCVENPRSIRVQATIAGEIATATANATTITVAIKKHDGTAGTSQTVYWEAIA